MELSDADRRLIAAIAEGLPLEPRPYAAIARDLSLSEADVMRCLHRLIDAGVIQRFGVIVRHREMGYRANAMVVWDVPHAETAAAGRRLAELPFVTLSYRRPRRPPDWPYNLFAMVHGRSRLEVERALVEIRALLGAALRSGDVLYSTRILKKTGMRLA